MNKDNRNNKKQQQQNNSATGLSGQGGIQGIHPRRHHHHHLLDPTTYQTPHTPGVGDAIIHVCAELYSRLSFVFSLMIDSPGMGLFFLLA